ncbi:DUF2076 family protein [Nocardia altamirensis]|uniref:DUF2076 family protein n=1 Tax=Nocardia altamirensis TaxID=472158 RepID=UPI0008409507|nr:DUF2076 family protein [Nocardia altamirensis]
MDHAEQQLIGNLAERIRAAQPVAEDPQATAAVQRLIGSQPDALYVLTQAVLLQEQALHQADSRPHNQGATLPRSRDAEG